MANYAVGFEASLVMYNLSDSKLDRTQFVNSLPERFLFAIAIGIPILLPAGELLSCEDVVLEHGIGYVFESEKHLADIVADQAAMRKAREAAAHYAKSQALEDEISALISFLDTVISNFRLKASSGHWSG